MLPGPPRYSVVTQLSGQLLDESPDEPDDPELPDEPDEPELPDELDEPEEPDDDPELADDDPLDGSLELEVLELDELLELELE